MARGACAGSPACGTTQTPRGVLFLREKDRLTGTKVYEPPKDHDEFYKLLGLCISRWSYTEEVLFSICQYILQTREDFAAIIYYRTPTLDSRLSLTDELLRAFLPKSEKKNGGHPHKLLTEWLKIRNKIRDLLPLRNSLAHHQVRQVYRSTYVDGGIDLGNGEFTFVRVASPLEIGASRSELVRGKEPIGPLSQSDIAAHYPKIEAARDELMKFQHRILHWRQQERLQQGHAKSPD